MERRWGNRVVLDETVTVKRDGELIGLACLHEVSLSGAFLKAHWRLPQLARVHVEVPRLHPNGHSRETLLEAFVVRHCTEGVGVEWCDFAPPEVVSIIDERRQIVPPTLRDHVSSGHVGEGTGPRRRMR